MACRMGGTRGLLALAIGVPLWLGDVALRHGAAGWLGAHGAATGPAAALGWALIDLLGVAALTAGLMVAARGASARRGWPWTTVLLITALVMHAGAAVLAFGSHDAELALAWSCVQALVLAVVIGGNLRRGAIAGAVAIEGARVGIFAASMAAITPVAW